MGTAGGKRSVGGGLPGTVLLGGEVFPHPSRCVVARAGLVGEVAGPALRATAEGAGAFGVQTAAVGRGPRPVAYAS